MTKQIEVNVDEAWKAALTAWSSPSVPRVIAPRNREERKDLGEIGSVLEKELAFMKYPEFQTFMNLERIVGQFPEDPQRGIKAVATHEIGHRFCPYDTITSIILNHSITKALEGQTLPYDAKAAAGNVLNLFADMCLNTRLSRNGNEDIPWAYEQISKGKKDKRMWRVYGRSMELAWDKELLPKNTVLKDDESKAAKELAELFKGGDFFNKSTWRASAASYATIIAPFLESEEEDGDSGMDKTPGQNLPKNIDEKTAHELAKRLAEIGSNGLPQNSRGLEEFQEIMAGFGQGDPKKASIHFYEMLSKSYDVNFVGKPFGRPRTSPFQPIRWTPSMGTEKLDIDYSVQGTGRILPGVGTYGWNSRTRQRHGGEEEVVPDLDIYMDSSMSMPDPCKTISLPVLAGFVAAKKAHRKGARVRATNFSAQGQSRTQDFTNDLASVFDVLVTHYNGGTVFPNDTLLAGQDPKQVIVITDTFLGNEVQTAEAITQLRQRHKGNRVAIYEIHSGKHGDYLRKAGAEVIAGNDTQIFKRVIGRAHEVYTR